MSAGDVVLWHLAMSHYNEKARWALEYKRVPHRRRAVMPGLHQLVALKLGGRVTMPVLTIGDDVYPDSTEIVAALEERCRTQGYARMVERETAPLADVVALITREAITGEAPPAAAKRMVDAWRPWVESRAGADFLQLSKLIEDQEAYASQVRRLIQDLDLGEEEQSSSEPDDDQSQGETPL